MGCGQSGNTNEQTATSSREVASAPAASAEAKTAFITGTNSGFGFAAVEELAAKGWNVIATVRDPTKQGDALRKIGDNVFVVAMDVQNADTVKSAVAAGIEKFGKIDVLVNNAGYASLGVFEGTSIEEFERQYDVNFFGVLRVTEAVLPHMRKVRNGTIVNLSSVAGAMTNVLGSTYYSSKWAIESWSECLSYELIPFNIQVKMVQPGYFKTDIFNPAKLGLAEGPEGIPEYAAMITGFGKKLEGMMPTMQGPKPIVSDAICAAAIDREQTNLRFPAFAENDPVGMLFNLRKAKGYEAQYGKIIASMNDGKIPESPAALEGPQTAFVTGTSTGLGKLIVEDLASRGWNVVATMRNPEKNGAQFESLENVLVLELDVEKQETIDKAVAAALEKFGKIDVLVNNAGIANFGVFEGGSIPDTKRQFDVNLFGVFRVTKAVVPHMRQAKNGTIVNVSSVVAGISNMLSSSYIASKAALEGWAECLSFELLKFNIQVKIVQPGAFVTDIYSKLNMLNGPEDVPEYAAMVKGMGEMMGAVLPNLPQPKPLLNEAIFAAATERNIEKMRYPVHGDNDPFATMFNLRKTEGPEAQYAAALASMQPKKE